MRKIVVYKIYDKIFKFESDQIISEATNIKKQSYKIKVIWNIKISTNFEYLLIKILFYK
jgi:hypothetical protein